MDDYDEIVKGPHWNLLAIGEWATANFKPCYGVVKAGKPFSDYELICEIQVKNGLDLGKNYRNINDCKNFTESIAQTLVDKQVQFQILSYKLGLGKSLTGIRLKKFKKPCPKKISTSGSYKISS